MTADAVVPMESGRALTAAAFQGLAAVPAAVEWFANLGNKATRWAYQNALADFMRFTGISQPEEFRAVTRAHVIAWRDEPQRGELGATSIRHRRSAITKPVSCSRHRIRGRSKACGIGRSWRRCCITRCVGMSCVSSMLRIFDSSAAACPI